MYALLMCIAKLVIMHVHVGGVYCLSDLINYALHDHLDINPSIYSHVVLYVCADGLSDEEPVATTATNRCVLPIACYCCNYYRVFFYLCNLMWNVTSIYPL